MHSHGLVSAAVFTQESAFCFTRKSALECPPREPRLPRGMPGGAAAAAGVLAPHTKRGPVAVVATPFCR
eukprot:2999567-Lingulodinium_polyedra.AAC.1